MPGTDKSRRRILGNAGAKIGSGGDNITEIKFGTVLADTAAVSASGDFAAASMAITGLDAGAKIILLPTNGVDGIMVYSACVASAGVVTASICSAIGEALSASTTINFQYIAFS